MTVVYFNQQTGALQAVCWSKSVQLLGAVLLIHFISYHDMVQEVPVCLFKYTTSVYENLFKVLLSNQYTQLSTFVSNPLLY